ncbi:F0F1 ATP synthase subunit delta [Aeromicrobium sp. CF3.5]|uniref:F0F1 ATP synthase subunit delta n=1 Tax=Aeromicrobium sp. CF3.5 TaxID=3373078 RepID=UPI003EE8002D
MKHQMRGVSAVSLTDVLAVVDGVSKPGADLSAELFAAVAAIDGAPALRRILTDPSTDAAAKQGLVSSVFGAKLGAASISILQAAVAGRWNSPRDLTDGLETAGVSAVVAAADAAGDLDALETEVFEIGRLVSSDAELRGVISDRGVSADAKRSLLTNLLDGKVSDSALALAVQAAVARRGSFERTLSDFGDTAAARRGRLLAEVRVAYTLDDDEKSRLTSALGAKYGHDVHLNIIVDPSVVGGISVSVGDEVADGTMSTRLETARRQLAG